VKCIVLLKHGWCSACYASRRGREAGHRKLPRLSEPVFNPFEESDVAMKRPNAEAVQPSGQSLKDEVFEGFYPKLLAHLSDTAWDDGKPRKTSTLLLLVENARWKAFFHDRDGKRGFWLSAESWEWLLEALEAAVDSSSTEWRKDTR